MNYPSGLPFSTKLAENLDEQLARVDMKKASLIIIDGGVGEGKTTLLVHVLNYINNKRQLPAIVLDGAQLSMGGVDFLKKIRAAYEEKLPCIGYDEAGDFNKRGSLSNFNSTLNRTFETFRAFKCIVVLCLPCFSVLDNHLFDIRVPRLLIHVHDRTNEYGNFDAYGLREMEWLRYWMRKSPIKAYAWGRVYPNFWGHFLDLDPADGTLLDKISTKNKLEILRKAEIKIEGLLTYVELATKLDYSVDMVRKAVANLKIKAKRIVGKVKYFDNDALNLLGEHFENVQANDGRGQNRWKNKKN